LRCHHNIVWRHDWSSKFFIILSFDDCFFLISQQTGNSICIVIRLNLEFYMFTTKITCPLVWIDLPQTHLQICHGHINCLHFLAVWIRLDLYINNSIIFLSANLLLMEHSLVVVCSLVSNYKWWDLVNYWSGGRLLSLFPENLSVSSSEASQLKGKPNESLNSKESVVKCFVFHRRFVYDYTQRVTNQNQNSEKFKSKLAPSEEQYVM